MEATFSPRFPRDTAAPVQPNRSPKLLLDTRVLRSTPQRCFRPAGVPGQRNFFGIYSCMGTQNVCRLGWPQMPKRPTFPTRPASGPCPPRQIASQVLPGTACGHPAAPLRHKTPQQPARMQVSVPPANIPARYPVQYPEAAAWTPRPFGTRPSSVPHPSAILSARAPSVPPKRTCPGPSQPQEFSHDC